MEQKVDARFLRALVDPRLRVPVVRNLYVAYHAHSIADHTVAILNMLSPEIRSPLLHTFQTHVTKEKAWFAFSIARKQGWSEDQAGSLAACVDMLWLLSLIFDDIEDKDEYRSGMESAWYKYGLVLAKRSMEAGFLGVQEKLARDWGKDVSSNCCVLVSLSLRSVAEQRKLTLNSSLQAVYNNYRARSAFHDRFTVETAFRNSPWSKGERLAKQALVAVNLAGQTLNDLKDLAAEYWFGRQELSDIREGAVTIPIKLLWDRLDPANRAEFAALFGRGSLREIERTFVNRALIECKVIPLVISEVQSDYATFIQASEQVVSPEDYPLFQSWYAYKVAQAHQVAGGEVNKEASNGAAL